MERRAIRWLIILALIMTVVTLAAGLGTRGRSVPQAPLRPSHAPVYPAPAKS
jgi:hypothetical protein